MGKFKIEWKPFIKKPKYFADVEEELEQILRKSFERQKSISGKTFPRKKKPALGRGAKYLWNTGAMVRSLDVIADEKSIYISIDKAEIYEKYLHDQTHWLPIGKDLGKKILEIIRKNVTEKWRKGR